MSMFLEWVKQVVSQPKCNLYCIKPSIIILKKKKEYLLIYIVRVIIFSKLNGYKNKIMFLDKKCSGQTQPNSFRPIPKIKKFYKNQLPKPPIFPPVVAGVACFYLYVLIIKNLAERISA